MSQKNTSAPVAAREALAPKKEAAGGKPAASATESERIKRITSMLLHVAAAALALLFGVAIGRGLQ